MLEPALTSILSRVNDPPLNPALLNPLFIPPPRTGLGATNPILTRLVMGALFPFGLLITLVCGAELYTGNTALVTAAVAEGKATPKVCVGGGLGGRTGVGLAQVCAQQRRFGHGKDVKDSHVRDAPMQPPGTLLSPFLPAPSTPASIPALPSSAYFFQPFPCPTPPIPIPAPRHRTWQRTGSGATPATRWARC